MPLGSLDKWIVDMMAFVALAVHSFVDEPPQGCQNIACANTAQGTNEAMRRQILICTEIQFAVYSHRICVAATNAVFHIYSWFN